jgi:hypothetical protein
MEIAGIILVEEGVLVTYTLEKFESLYPAQKTFFRNRKEHEDIPEKLQTPEFEAKWEEWKAYRKEKKKPLTPVSVKKQIHILSEHTVRDAINIIEKSMTNGWTGLFATNEFEMNIDDISDNCKIIMPLIQSVDVRPRKDMREVCEEIEKQYFCLSCEAKEAVSTLKRFVMRYVALINERKTPVQSSEFFSSDKGTIKYLMQSELRREIGCKVWDEIGACK